MITARARDVHITKSANDPGYLNRVADDVSDHFRMRQKSVRDAYERRIDHRKVTERVRDLPDRK